MTKVLTRDRAIRAAGPRARRRRPPYLAGGIALLVLALALLGPLVAPYGASEQVGAPFQQPGGGLLLGTNILGPDVASRVLGGGRTIVLIAVAGTVLAGVIGVTAGVLAAMVSPRFGDFVLRAVDALAVLPALLLILVLAAGFPGSDTAVVAAVALATAPFSVRVLRAWQIPSSPADTSRSPAPEATVEWPCCATTCCPTSLGRLSWTPPCVWSPRCTSPQQPGSSVSDGVVQRPTGDAWSTRTFRGPRWHSPPFLFRPCCS